MDAETLDKLSTALRGRSAVGVSSWKEGGEEERREGWVRVIRLELRQNA